MQNATDITARIDYLTAVSSDLHESALLSALSDAYKSRHGVRPHWLYDESEATQRAALRDLWTSELFWLIEQEDIRKEREREDREREERARQFDESFNRIPI